MDQYNIYSSLYSSTWFQVMFLISMVIIIVFIIYVICKKADKDERKISNTTYNNTYKDKGTIGEDEIDSYLSRLNPDNYIVLRDLVLLSNNSTHQIDHVVVSNYGIFIIETKNYTGLVKGSDKYGKWVQFIGRKKYFFLNPIIQNKGHIKAIETFLPEYSSYFVPIVCFTNKTKLSVKSNSIVINSSLLLSTIYNYKNEILIPDINEVAQNLKNISLDRMNGIEHDHLNNVSKYKR